MGILIDSDDFVGRYAIAQGTYASPEIDAYIDANERHILVDLMGVYLFELFEADLVNQVPQTQRFIDIYDPFQLDDDSCVRVSEGMKTMLLGLIYLLYVRDQTSVNTAMGPRDNNAENSDKSMGLSRGLIQRYNQSVDTYHQIQWYICDNDDVYPEENVQHKSYISPF